MEDIKEIASWFEYEAAALEDLTGSHVVHSCYQTYSYEGDWVVIYVKGGEWYVASGGHCSCNGPSWSPQPTTRDELLSQYSGSADGDIRKAIESCGVLA